MKKIIILLFLIGIGIRFLYFPDNVYFGYDQARDSFASLEILTGHLKLIGPPSSLNDNLFHGPLIYYIYAPIYLLSNHNPEAVSIFLRIYNALGIFLVFIIASILFNKKVGFISALIFTFSYEQSQYSLFFGHPALAVNTVLLFYLGLVLFIFKKNSWGLALALLGLGCSIQFHYSQAILFIPLFILLIGFRKLLTLNLKPILATFLIFLLTISSFILAEFKFNFRLTSALINQFSNLNKITTQRGNFNHVLEISQRLIHDNFLSDPLIIWLFSLILFVSTLIFIFKKKFGNESTHDLSTRVSSRQSDKIIFLLIWFLAGLLPYFLTSSPSYYYNPAASVSLIIFFAILVYYLSQKTTLAYLLVVPILLSNMNLIINLNSAGPNPDIVIQKGMLISFEKQALDYIYSSAKGNPFAINALTIPLNINTTWSYLFEWYGIEKYHYLPTWGGETALGYAGHLTITPQRSKLPSLQFLIIEPTEGIRESYQENFFREESYFTKIIEEKKFGTITIQKRQMI